MIVKYKILSNRKLPKSDKKCPNFVIALKNKIIQCAQTQLTRLLMVIPRIDFRIKRGKQAFIRKSGRVRGKKLPYKTWKSGIYTEVGKSVQQETSVENVKNGHLYGSREERAARNFRPKLEHTGLIVLRII